MKNEIIEKLKKIVKELTEEDFKIEINRSNDSSHGDFVSNIALILAKKIGRNPREVAQEIAEFFGPMEGIEKVEVAGPGFINFYVSPQTLITQVQKMLSIHTNAPLTDTMKGRKVIIEFTDPNPFKEFHIGHVYTNTIGEALSRLYESNGAVVQRADYYGDVGMHIGKALWGLQRMFEQNNVTMKQLGEKPLSERISYFGKAYAKGSTAYEEDPQAAEEMKKINKLVYIAAQKMWQKEKGLEPQVDYVQGMEIDQEAFEKVYEMYTLGRKWSLENFDAIYKRLGMQFTGDYPESIAGEKGYQLVQQHIEDGTFVKSNGAIVFPGEKYGLHTRVFINSLGLPTYEAKELGLAVWKNEEFPYDYSIILTGNEINEYFKVLMKALSLVKPDLAVKSRHIGHGMVKLASGKKMSSRTGEIISGKEVLDEGKALAKKKIAEAKIGKNAVGQADAEIVAEQVGVGAIKYAFLKSGIGRDIPFSFEESVSFEGNAGPYVQYTYVRTKSILEKAGEKLYELSLHGYDMNAEELEILRQLEKLPETVREAAEQIAPSMLTGYLYELAKSFNTFYQKHRIADASSEEEKEFRLGLTRATGAVLKKGLNLLGIAAPEKM